MGHSSLSTFLILISISTFTLAGSNHSDYEVTCLSPYLNLFPKPCPIQDPEPQPNINDCLDAAQKIHTDPDYDRVLMFGNKHRPGVQRTVPIDWTINTCLIHLETKDLGNIALMSLSTVYNATKEIIDQCVAKKSEGQRQGGYVELGEGGGFYVMVQANPGEAYLRLEYSLKEVILPRLAIKGGFGVDSTTMAKGGVQIAR